MAKEDLFHVEANILPRSKLIIVFCGLAFSLLICFVDQNSIGIALPTIGQDLNCASTVSWAGTSSLIANTVFQVLWGRLSDIFGRKAIYLSSVGLLAVGDILCGFAKTGTQLYIFRGVSGAATGGIIAMTLTIVSDIVTLEERGRYQGILGSMVGLGNAIGPFLAAALVEKATWRAIFWTICPVAALAGVIQFFLLPPSIVVGDPKQKAKAIDYYGFGLSTIAVTLILIPISGGGTYFAWSSPMVITMLVIGSIATVIFLFVEWKVAVMPMIEMRLFRIPAVCAILIQNFLFGIVYYSHLYYLPIYYQDARQYSPLTSAALTIPFVAGQSVSSIASGQYITHRKRYMDLVWSGFSMWLLGSGLLLLLDRTTPDWKIILILIVEGFGVGFVFQPTLIAAQAHSRMADRAIVIGIRNFLRALGGAIGLALSAAVFSNVFTQHVNELSDTIPQAFKDLVLGSVVKVPDLTGLSESQQSAVLDVYMAGSRAVFIMWVPTMALCMVLCVFIKDKGLIRPEEKKDEDVIAESLQRSEDDPEQGLELQSRDESRKQSKDLDEERCLTEEQERPVTPKVWKASVGRKSSITDG